MAEARIQLAARAAKVQVGATAGQMVVVRVTADALIQAAIAVVETVALDQQMVALTEWVAVEAMACPQTHQIRRSHHLSHHPIPPHPRQRLPQPVAVPLLA